MDSLNDLASQPEQFAKEREWQQLHSPKKLRPALTVEAAELLAWNSSDAVVAYVQFDDRLSFDVASVLAQSGPVND
jgi:hypothetical protein